MAMSVVTSRHCSRIRQTLTSLKRHGFATDGPSRSARLPSFRDACVSFTDPPSPGWKIGEGANGLQANQPLSNVFKTFCFAEPQSFSEGYRLLISAIVPRPIAFVSSLSVDGVPNLAPFSYFSMVSHNPPLLSISFSCRRPGPKTPEKIFSLLRNSLSTLLVTTSPRLLI